MKKKYIKPTTLFTLSRLQYHVLQGTPVMPYDPTDGTVEALTKDENRWEDSDQDDSWDKGFW